MAGDSKQNLKQLRVDNWAVFFLQRLQLLFAKGDCCDLTLKFVNGQELKVHRLVLSTSTSFFESMESRGNVIHLPETLPYSVVQPIINFLYSGRLEFKAELHSQLLAIAKIMKLAILARILVSQKNDNGFGDHNTSTGKVMDIKKVKFKTPAPSKGLTPSSPYVNILAGKKLPIWKKRTVPYSFERKPVKEEEPRPTRFEWPDEETCNNMLLASPSFTLLSYESAPVISPPVTPPTLLSDSLPTTSLKRRVMPPPSSNIPDKIFKVDGNSIIGNNTSECKSSDNEIPCENISDDDDYDDDGHFETIHTYGDSDDDDADIDSEPCEIESTVNQLKPILKPMAESPALTPSKKVRFSFTPEDKENKSEKIIENIETPKSSDKKDITNHAKIIQEVLKKYPELVKNSKNIKLKITAPGSGNKQETITIDTKRKSFQSKSSYIVVKKTESLNTSQIQNENGEKSTLVSTTPITGENSKGPWKCEPCSTGGKVLKFDSYFDYKKHMQDAHTGIDSRICEYCGYKASKRNLHLYHLYTKHGVDPPKNIKFPKCSQCSYIALSESLLVKHLNSHQLARDLTCLVCNTTFKTYSSLHVHSLSCKPNSEVRSHPCTNCKKVFKTNVSLNAHVKVCTINNEESDEGGGSHTSSEVIEVPIIETVELNKDDQALVQIPSGIILAESPSVALLPSESEALNNVASSIATSIGLTVALPQEHEQAVILLDGNSQFFLQGNESVVVSDDNGVGEYIVPEILRDEMGQIYTTQNVPYTVTSTGVITCPIMSIQSTSDISKEKINEHNNSSSIIVNTDKHNNELKSSDNEFSSRILETVDTHLQSSNTRVEIRDSQAEDLDVAQLEKALQSPELPEDPEEDTVLSQNITNDVSNCENSQLCNTNTSDGNIINISDERNIQNDEEEKDKGEQKDEDEIHIDLNMELEEAEQRKEEEEEEGEGNEGQSQDENNLQQNETEEVEENKDEDMGQDQDENGETQVNTDSSLLVDDRSINNEEDELINETTLADIENNQNDKAISLVRDWGFDNEEDSEDDIEEPESRPSRPTVELDF